MSTERQVPQDYLDALVKRADDPAYFTGGNCAVTGTVTLNNPNDHIIAWATVYTGARRRATVTSP